MGIKVGINGFGRIGRMVFRAGLKNPNIEFVAVNDPFMTRTTWHTCSSMTPCTVVTTAPSSMMTTPSPLMAKKVQFFAEMDPKNIPWGKVGADYVVESTGVFPDQGEGTGSHRWRC